MSSELRNRKQEPAPAGAGGKASNGTHVTATPSKPSAKASPPSTDPLRAIGGTAANAGLALLFVALYCVDAFAGPELAAQPPAATKRFASFDEFFPFYLTEHAELTNRKLHFVGTALALAVAGTHPLTLVAMVYAGTAIADRVRCHPRWSLSHMVSVLLHRAPGGCVLALGATAWLAVQLHESRKRIVLVGVPSGARS